MLALTVYVVVGLFEVVLVSALHTMNSRNRRMVADTIEALEEDTIVITHDLGLVEGVERLLLFHEGRLIADGKPDETIRRYHEVAGC